MPSRLGPPFWFVQLINFLSKSLTPRVKVYNPNSGPASLVEVSKFQNNLSSSRNIRHKFSTFQVEKNYGTFFPLCHNLKVPFKEEFPNYCTFWAKKCAIIWKSQKIFSCPKHVFLHHRNLRKKSTKAQRNWPRRAREVGFFWNIKHLSRKGANSKGSGPNN